MSKLHAILVAAAAAFAFGSPPAQASTFTFTGNCTLDCTGTADATLVLTGYMLGNNITKPNFVSLTYHSTFMSFSVTPAELSLIGGTFTPPPLPGAELVSITWLVSGNMMTLQTPGLSVSFFAMSPSGLHKKPHGGAGRGMVGSAIQAIPN